MKSHAWVIRCLTTNCQKVHQYVTQVVPLFFFFSHIVTCTVFTMVYSFEITIVAVVYIASIIHKLLLVQAKIFHINHCAKYFY
jgi:hypothetical protein